jgi:hypothetical protein
MPYVFEETPSGCVITHTFYADAHITLSLDDTALVVEAPRRELRHAFGLFDYYAMAHWIVSELLAPRCEPDPPRRKQAWREQTTGRRIGKALHAQWKRLLAQADPSVVAVQRAVFAATFSAPSLLHDRALYHDPWVVRDIVTYRAAASAVALLAPREPAHLEDYPFDLPRTLDETELPAYLALRRSQLAQETEAAEPPEDALLERLRNWRNLFSPSGQAYPSLNKTLDRLPRIPTRLLGQLNRVRLERPITRRLELLLLLSHVATAYGPMWQRHLHLYMHARAEQIAEAMRRVDAHTHNDLRLARSHDMQVLVQFLNDYPEPHRGTIVGLADKSIVWHRHAQAHVQSQTVLALGGDSQTARPPIPLPEDGHISFLATVGAVVAEGAAMGHCIASYARQAVVGQCYLFHVEYAGEQASVEVGMDGRVRQSFGPRNQRNAASAWAEQALKEWGRAIPALAGVSTKLEYGVLPMRLLPDGIPF